VSADKTGGPAFPQPAIDNAGRMDYADQVGYGGMTLRDYFAAQALIGLMAACADKTVKEGKDANEVAAGVAIACYSLADAMLAERNK
jgi:hypothetical protein